MGQSDTILGTHWEVVEHVENLIRKHWGQNKSNSPPPYQKEKIWAPWVHVASTHCMPRISIPTYVL